MAVTPFIADWHVACLFGYFLLEMRNFAPVFAGIGTDRDWAGAEREFRRAIDLNPNYANGHHGYAEFLSLVGRHEQAIAESDPDISSLKRCPLPDGRGSVSAYISSWCAEGPS